MRVTYTDAGTGVKKRKSLYANTQKEVLAKRKDFLSTLENGVYTPPTKWTVGGWLAVWVKEYTAHLHYLTVVNYEGIIRNHITPALGKAKLSALTTPAVQSFYNELNKPTAKRPALGGSTINGIHAVLHSALDKAVELHYMPSNPSDRCKRPKIQKPDIHPMDEAQTTQFLNALRGEKYERILLLDLFTGLRKSELVGLSWDCINFNEGTIRIYRQLQAVKGGHRFGPLKNDKPRTITPPPSAMRLLHEQKLAQNEMRLRAGKAWNNPERLVFTHGDGTHYCAHTVYLHYKRIVASMGLPDLRMHDLRHTYATSFLQDGNNMKEVSESMGHGSMAFTADTYLHPTERMRKDSAERMEAFMNSLKSDNTIL